ncbi:MAG: GTPase [Planctomycetota bacterium]
MSSVARHTNTDETLASLLTALAPGAIAVIALHGVKTEGILQAILRRPKSDAVSGLRLNSPTLCRVVENGQTLDDAIVIVSENGHAEIHTHGGVRIAQRVLMLLASQGAAVVAADEFVERTASGDPILRDIDTALLRSTSRRLTMWLLAQREILPPFLARIGETSKEERGAFSHRTHVAVRLLRGITIAIIGPPNAGKSTLANRLIGHDRVLTSDQPGTTRDWISETALINGWPVTLTDTAGLRDADCVIEAEAIRRGREQAHAADLVLIALNATTTEGDQYAAYRVAVDSLPSDTPRLVVFNKCDSSTARSMKLDGPQSCKVSALQGNGVEELESRIEAVLGLNQLDDSRPTGIRVEHCTQ